MDEEKVAQRQAAKERNCSGENRDRPFGGSGSADAFRPAAGRRAVEKPLGNRRDKVRPTRKQGTPGATGGPFWLYPESED